MHGGDSTPRGLPSHATHASHMSNGSAGSAADALAAIAGVHPATAAITSSGSSEGYDAPRVKTRHYVIPFVVLGTIVFASAIQTETASYLASGYGFDKPYFCFFVTHSTFALVFPVHLGLLLLFNRTRYTWRERTHQLLRNLRAVLADQLGTPPRWRAVARPLINKLVPLTALISLPAICWFIAMAFSPAMDITAIYATSAFFAYFFSLLILGTKLTRMTLGAIAVAFAGVCILTLAGAGGGAKPGPSDDGGDKGADTAPPDQRTGMRRVIGDMIMVVGAVLLGLYEVVYKTVLPESQGGATHAHHPAAAPSHVSAANYSSVPTEDTADVESVATDDYPLGEPALGRPGSAAIATAAAGTRTPLLPKANSRSGSPTRAGVAHAHPRTSYSPTPSDTVIRSSPPGSVAVHVHPPTPTQTRAPPSTVPKLPTAFHSNFLTSAIGVATLVLLWPPFPILHFTGLESFDPPSGTRMWQLITVVAVGGAIYNAGLMILIGVWGPTTSSVANLLTIGLVAIMDALWMGHAPDLQTFIGAALICAGFGVLLWEGEED